MPRDFRSRNPDRSRLDYRQWNPAAGKHIVHKGVNLREVRELSPRNKLEPDDVIRVQPPWHCNIAINGCHYFLTSTGASPQPACAQGQGHHIALGATMWKRGRRSISSCR